MPSAPRAPQDRKPAKKTTRKRTSPSTSQPAEEQPQDPNSKYRPDAWASGGIGGMDDITVPSGQLCLVRRPGMEGLMKAGVLHNVDSLSQIVNEKHLKRVQGKPTNEIDMSSLMQDDKGMDEVMNVIDKVICHCVVQPVVHRTPNDVTNRKPGVIYADMVDLVDKLFLFNYVVGGTRDLESFRSGLDTVVGSVETQPVVSQQT
jgi:hypothetical protein